MVKKSKEQTRRTMAEEQKQQIPLRIADEELKGRYSNLIKVTHSSEEFVLEFFNVFPPAGIAVARVVMSPGHLKRMISALETNLQNYEKKFGKKVKAADEPDSGGIGFRP